MLPHTSDSLIAEDGSRPRYEIGLVLGHASEKQNFHGTLWDILIMDGVKTIHIQDVKPLFDKEGECLYRNTGM